MVRVFRTATLPMLRVHRHWNVWTLAIPVRNSAPHSRLAMDYEFPDVQEVSFAVSDWVSPAAGGRPPAGQKCRRSRMTGSGVPDHRSIRLSAVDSDLVNARSRYRTPFKWSVSCATIRAAQPVTSSSTRAPFSL